MNLTERIKAGFVGKSVMTDEKTGKKHIVNFDDTENIGILSSEELKILFGDKRGRLTEEDHKKIHFPGDEFEDLEFLKEYGIDIDKLMNEDYE